MTIIHRFSTKDKLPFAKKLSKFAKKSVDLTLLIKVGLCVYLFCAKKCVDNRKVIHKSQHKKPLKNSFNCSRLAPKSGVIHQFTDPNTTTKYLNLKAEL